MFLPRCSRPRAPIVSPSCSHRVRRQPILFSIHSCCCCDMPLASASSPPVFSFESIFIAIHNCRPRSAFLTLLIPLKPTGLPDLLFWQGCLMFPVFVMQSRASLTCSSRGKYRLATFHQRWPSFFLLPVANSAR